MFKNGKYEAYIRRNNVTHHLGRFKTLEEAAEARLEAEKKYGKSNVNHHARRETLKLQGFKINHLTVIEETGKSEKDGRIWLCKCDCGRTFEAVAWKIKSGRIKGCGNCEPTLITGPYGRKPHRPHECKVCGSYVKDEKQPFCCEECRKMWNNLKTYKSKVKTGRISQAAFERMMGRFDSYVKTKQEEK